MHYDNMEGLKKDRHGIWVHINKRLNIIILKNNKKNALHHYTFKVSTKSAHIIMFHFNQNIDSTVHCMCGRKQIL